jgi:hypothetical protein
MAGDRGGAGVTADATVAPDDLAMSRIRPLDEGTHIPARGRCYLYVFPCGWEDLCKLGISRDPLERLQALHPRWFEFFDLERGMLVELDRVREARDLELALGHVLAEHNAMAPLTICAAAGGHTEWYRGASSRLAMELDVLGERGHVLHALRPWLTSTLAGRCDRLYGWTQASLDVDALESSSCALPAHRAVRDALDAHGALGIDIAPWVPDAVLAWYRRVSSNAGPAALR